MVYVNHIRVNNTPERGKEIGRQHAAGALAGGQSVGGIAMSDAPGTGSIIRRQVLSSQRGDDAGEHIAHPAAGHPGIAGVDNAHRPAFTGHHRARAFQHNHAAIPFYQTLRRK